jgi:hypothetical protein
MICKLSYFFELFFQKNIPQKILKISDHKTHFTTTATMEYHRAGDFVKRQITINANPFFEPIAKKLLKKMAPLPYHYHNTF